MLLFSFVILLLLYNLQNTKYYYLASLEEIPRLIYVYVIIILILLINKLNIIKLNK